jgi:hypothetical protein
MEDHAEVVFPEPTLLRDEALGAGEPQSHFFTEMTSPEAKLARARVNSWYKNSRLAENRNWLRRVRDERDDQNLYSALDELFVDHLLIDSGRRVIYEKEGTGDWPDFSILTGDGVYAGVEVVSIFTDRDEQTWDRAMAQLTEGVNKRFKCSTHFITLEPVKLNGSPSAVKVAEFLTHKMRSLTGDAQKALEGPELEITYESVNLTAIVKFYRYSQPIDNPDIYRSVEVYPHSGGLVTLGERMTKALRGKSASDYPAIEGSPFAVVAFSHDPFWSVTQIERAVFGQVVFAPAPQPPVRIGNGLIRHDGTNFTRRSTGAIFFVPRWSCWEEELPEIYRVNHPRPQIDFPEDLIKAHYLLVSATSEGTPVMHWNPTPPRGITVADIPRNLASGHL